MAWSKGGGMGPLGLVVGLGAGLVAAAALKLAGGMQSRNNSGWSSSGGADDYGDDSDEDHRDNSRQEEEDEESSSDEEDSIEESSDSIDSLDLLKTFRRLHREGRAGTIDIRVNRQHQFATYKLFQIDQSTGHDYLEGQPVSFRHQQSTEPIHTERVLLDEMRAQIAHPPTNTRTPVNRVVMYSHLSPCDDCMDAIIQFAADNPDIEIHVGFNLYYRGSNRATYQRYGANLPDNLRIYRVKVRQGCVVSLIPF